jgi:hypothetical protein
MFLEFLEIIFALRGCARQIIGKLFTLFGAGFLLINELIWNTEGSPFFDFYVSGDTYLILFLFAFFVFLQREFKPNSKILNFFTRAAQDYKKEVLENDILQAKPTKKLVKKRKKISVLKTIPNNLNQTQK